MLSRRWLSSLGLQVRHDTLLARSDGLGFAALRCQLRRVKRRRRQAPRVVAVGVNEVSAALRVVLGSVLHSPPARNFFSPSSLARRRLAGPLCATAAPRSAFFFFFLPAAFVPPPAPVPPPPPAPEPPPPPAPAGRTGGSLGTAGGGPPESPVSIGVAWSPSGCGSQLILHLRPKSYTCKCKILH